MNMMDHRGPSCMHACINGSDVRCRKKLVMVFWPLWQDESKYRGEAVRPPTAFLNISEATAFCEDALVVLAANKLAAHRPTDRPTD